jgi:hypothetical protein
MQYYSIPKSCPPSNKTTAATHSLVVFVYVRLFVYRGCFRLVDLHPKGTRLLRLDLEYFVLC